MDADGGVLIIGEGIASSSEPPEYPVLRVRSLSAGLQALSEGGCRLTLLSAELVEDEPELIRRVASHPHAGSLVLVSRSPSLELALRAPSLGAAQLLSAPVSAEQIRTLLAGKGTPGGAVVPLPAAAAGDALVGNSPALVEVFTTVGRVGPSDATLLVTGESGTGKELVARAVHRISPRSGGPFIAVNCAAIPEDLLESELFGHEKGAFTGAVARKIGRFERAAGGTLFLDEIGDMSLVLQAKILRAVQEREIERLGGEERIRLDVRLVAATHRDLSQLVAAGEFREDLYYRLAVVRLHLPPLRSRPGDVRALALHYLAQFAAAHQRPVTGVEGAALRRLEAHRWPGNVRELRNVTERAVLVANGGVVREQDLELDTGPAPAAEPDAAPLPGYRPTLSFAEMEALHLRQVLRHVDGQVGRAAQILGVHRNTVSRKAAEYGITDVRG